MPQERLDVDAPPFAGGDGPHRLVGNAPLTRKAGIAVVDEIRGKNLHQPGSRAAPDKVGKSGAVSGHDQAGRGKAFHLASQVVSLKASHLEAFLCEGYLDIVFVLGRARAHCPARDIQEFGPFDRLAEFRRQE